METEKQKVIDYFKGTSAAELIIHPGHLLQSKTSALFRVHSIRIPTGIYSAVVSLENVDLLQSGLGDSVALFVDSADVRIGTLPGQTKDSIIVSLKQIRAQFERNSIKIGTKRSFADLERDSNEIPLSNDTSKIISTVRRKKRKVS
eukprot:1091151_1